MSKSEIRGRAYRLRERILDRWLALPLGSKEVFKLAGYFNRVQIVLKKLNGE